MRVRELHRTCEHIAGDDAASAWYGTHPPSGNEYPNQVDRLSSSDSHVASRAGIRRREQGRHCGDFCGQTDSKSRAIVGSTHNFTAGAGRIKVIESN